MRSTKGSFDNSPISEAIKKLTESDHFYDLEVIIGVDEDADREIVNNTDDVFLDIELNY